MVHAIIILFLHKKGAAVWLTNYLSALQQLPYLFGFMSIVKVHEKCLSYHIFHCNPLHCITAFLSFLCKNNFLYHFL